jgi:hypothetical protein
MITVELARALLRDAGVLWAPAAGDRFVIDAELLTGEVFWISDLTVEVQTYRDQSLLGFNGTTEWALDSLEAGDALWLPREDQLREVLGEAFMELAYLPGETPGYAVSMLLGDEERRFVDVEPEAAYARAVLALLGHSG